MEQGSLLLFLLVSSFSQSMCIAAPFFLRRHCLLVVTMLVLAFSMAFENRLVLHEQGLPVLKVRSSTSKGVLFLSTNNYQKHSNERETQGQEVTCSRSGGSCGAELCRIRDHSISPHLSSSSPSVAHRVRCTLSISCPSLLA